MTEHLRRAGRGNTYRQRKRTMKQQDRIELKERIAIGAPLLPDERNFVLDCVNKAAEYDMVVAQLTTARSQLEYLLATIRQAYDRVRSEQTIPMSIRLGDEREIT